MARASSRRRMMLGIRRCEEYSRDVSAGDDIPRRFAIVSKGGVEGLVERAKKGNPNFELPKLLKDPIYPLDGAKKVAAKLSEMTGKLAALDRYERRALSRRKFAIREFDNERQSSPVA